MLDLGGGGGDPRTGWNGEVTAAEDVRGSGKAEGEEVWLKRGVGVAGWDEEEGEGSWMFSGFCSKSKQVFEIKS